MKVRIISKSNQYYNKEFYVVKMNYDYILVNDRSKNVKFQFEDVELLSDNPLEKIIIEYRDIIKIELNRGISLRFYWNLISFIEENISGRLEKLEVLYDDYSIIRKNIWEKNIKVVVNDKIPLYINVIGRKFYDKFDINIKNISIQDFIEDCYDEIRKNKLEIEKIMIENKRREKAVKNVIGNRFKGSENSFINLSSPSI